MTIVAVVLAVGAWWVLPVRAMAAPPLPVDGGAPGKQWLAAHDGPPKYPGRFPGEVHVDFDVPIRMSDGTILKANIYRPMDAAGNVVTTPLPTIVGLTPYTKFAMLLADAALSIPWLSDFMINLFNSVDLTGTPLDSVTDLTRMLSGGAARTTSVDRKLIQQGYTQVVADTRGTGYSQGTWQFFQGRETEDSVDLINWAAHQPWSTGKIGMNGTSYSGINQFKAAEQNPPALKAIVPIEGSTDVVNDVAAPGGGLGAFAPIYITLIDIIKNIPDLTGLIQGHFDAQWLRDRISTPFEFFDYILMALVPSVKDLQAPLVKQLQPGSPLRQGFMGGDPASIKVPTLAYGGWQDIFSSSNTHLYDRLSLPDGEKKMIVGNTYHLNPGSGLGNPGQPPRLDVLAMAWYDHWLKGKDNGITRYGPVVMLKQNGGGPGTWVVLNSFGKPDVAYRRMYLSPSRSGTANSLFDGTLAAAAPKSHAQLTISPWSGATSLCSRDSAVESAGVLSVIDACSKDNRIHELGGLTFTTPPLATSMTLSGPLVVHLNTRYDTADGYWAVDVVDVAPDGQSTVISGGQLTASLRAIDPARSYRDAKGDYTDVAYRLTLDSRQPVVPGQATTLDIAIRPVLATLAPGHRLRIDVFASNFPRGLLLPPLLVESGGAPQHLDLDPTAPSFVNLPIA